MSARLIAALGLVLPLLSGCAVAAVGAAGTLGVSAAQERSVGGAIDDTSTATNIKTRLISHGGLGEVDVEIAEGLVLLTGRVNTPEQRVKAEDIAWSVRGTRDVANEIRIEPPGGFVKNAGDVFTSSRVRLALTRSTKVRGINFNIETYDGVVYLMGTARSREEMVAAAEKASIVGGVKQVISYIHVRDTPRPPSAGGPDGAYTGDADAELRGGS